VAFWVEMAVLVVVDATLDDVDDCGVATSDDP
jgi:hypothetical protein